MPESLETNGQIDTPEPVSSAPSDPLSGVVEHYRSQGYELPDGISGKDILSKLHEKATSGPDPQLMQYANYGRQYADLQQSKEWKEYNDWLKQRKEQEKAQQPKEDPNAFKWEVPQFKEDWRNHVRLDPDTGAYVPANAYASPAAVAEANAYQRASQEHLRRMLHEFPQLVDQIVSPKLKGYEEKFGEMFQKQLDRYLAQQNVRGYLKQNEQDIYVIDPRTGQPAIDPNTGREALNHQGKLMEFYLNEGWDMLQRISGPIDQEKGPSQEQWDWVQHYAMTHVPRDAQAAAMWRDYAMQMQQPQQQAPPQQYYQEPQAPPPSPEERNAEIKARSVARAKENLKTNPGTVTPSRRVANAAATPSVPRSLRERIEAKFGAV